MQTTTIRNRSLSLQERSHALAQRSVSGGRRKRKDPPACGWNKSDGDEHDLDITNGTRGTIIDVILNHQEPPLEVGSVVVLKHLPQCVLLTLSQVGLYTRRTPQWS